MSYSMEKDFQKAMNFKVDAPLKKIKAEQESRLDEDVGIINSVLFQKETKQPTIEQLLTDNQYYCHLLNDINARLLDIITFYDFFSKAGLKKNIDAILSEISGEKND